MVNEWSNLLPKILANGEKATITREMEGGGETTFIYWFIYWESCHPTAPIFIIPTTSCELNKPKTYFLSRHSDTTMNFECHSQLGTAIRQQTVSVTTCRTSFWSCSGEWMSCIPFQWHRRSVSTPPPVSQRKSCSRWVERRQTVTQGWSPSDFQRSFRWCAWRGVDTPTSKAAQRGQKWFTEELLSLLATLLQKGVTVWLLKERGETDTKKELLSSCSTIIIYNMHYFHVIMIKTLIIFCIDT